jgi:rhodanese-related sulfurtransferase
MKTILAAELGALMDEGTPVDILDIRPRCDFDAAHIVGAHWLSSSRVSSEAIVFARELLPTEPLYLVSQSGALAQLTACELERQGSDNIFVVAGGMRACEKCSVPVVREQSIAWAQ